MRKLIKNRYVRNKRVARVMDYCPTLSFRQAEYMRDRTELGYQRTRRLKSFWDAAPNGSMVGPAWFPWEATDWGVRIGYRMIALETGRLYHGFDSIDWPATVEQVNTDPRLKTTFKDVQELLSPYLAPQQTGKSFVLTEEVHDAMRHQIEKHCKLKIQKEAENDMGAEILQKEIHEHEKPVTPLEIQLDYDDLFSQEDEQHPDKK